MELSSHERIGGGKVTKIDRYNWIIQDSPGRFQMINKDYLTIDNTYQRNTTRTKALAIAREWSWIACSTITVALRNGEYYVIDGQHRVSAAMRRSDIDDLPCLVFDVVEIAQEAKGFLTANTQRKPIYAHEKLRAMIVVGNQEALLVQELCELADRTITYNSSANTVGCCSAMLRWAKLDPSKLKNLWPLILMICEGNPLHNRILDGLMYIEERMPNGDSLTDKKWKHRLLKIGYTAFLDAAAKATSFFSAGGAKPWAIGMLEAINKGLREKLVLTRDI
jgi:hypothetical protein